MADTTAEFVNTLEQWRLALGVGHAAFARRIGVSHAYWAQMRHRRREASRGLISRAIGIAGDPWRSALEQAHLRDLRATDQHGDGEAA